LSGQLRLRPVPDSAERARKTWTAQKRKLLPETFSSFSSPVAMNETNRARHQAFLISGRYRSNSADQLWSILLTPKQHSIDQIRMMFIKTNSYRGTARCNYRESMVRQSTVGINDWIPAANYPRKHCTSLMPVPETNGKRRS
jgi:hypothetical protein